MAPQVATAGTVALVAPLDPEEIERALNKLLKGVGSPDHPATRARVRTLVVAGLEQSDLPTVTQSLIPLTLRHPMRTILLVRTETPGPLRAWLTAHCHLPPGGAYQVCHEQIVIEGPPGAEHHFGPVVTALLLPDLPVTVWWARWLPIAHPLFRQVNALAESVIIDSGALGGALPLYGRLSQVVRSVSPYWRDLRWLGLTPWRKLLADLFDIPALQTALPALRQVTVTLADRSSGLASGLLFIGWLAACLGWEPVAWQRTVEGLEWQFVAPSGRPAADLVFASPAAPLAICLRLPTLELVLEGSPDGEWLTVETPGQATHLERTVRLGPAGAGVWLAQALALTDPDLVYLSTLEMIARLVGLVGAEEAEQWQ
jgi:glucose-6-phosphate dehydrogenase assembly protein OpcA